MRLIDHYKQDLEQHSTVSMHRKVRIYWHRAIAETILERSMTLVSVLRYGTHGDRVIRYKPFWNQVSDEELLEVFRHLAPWF